MPSDGERPMTYREIYNYLAEHPLSVEDDDFDFSSLPRGVRRWLTHDLLPTIRKTGSYRFPHDLDAECPYSAPAPPGHYA